MSSAETSTSPARGRIVWVLLCVGAVLASCGDAGSGDSDALVMYTTVTQETVDAVVAAFQEANPDGEIEVFRAPTGEVTARIAAELRNGELGADILWLTDPLSIQQYEADGLLRQWTPEEAESVPAEYRTETFFGTRILNMVIIAGEGEQVSDWSGLPDLGSVAIPDPSFAGSAFGALAYFALDPAYGLDFYRDLRSNGAVQVNSPGDVVSGVAEGIYRAGMTLDFSARAAIADGSPVQLIWPESGGIAIYSPIAIVDSSGSALAEDFVNLVLSAEGQSAIAATGWQPIRSDVSWEHGGPQVTVNWSRAFDRQEELLDDYRSLFES